MTRDEAIKENIARRILANQARVRKALDAEPTCIAQAAQIVASPKRKRLHTVRQITSQ